MKRKNRTFRLFAVLFLGVLASTVMMPHSASAAVSVNLYAPAAGSVTWDSASVTTEVVNYQGSDYEMYLQYQPTGDTMHYTAQSVYTFDWAQLPITGLPANKVITVRAVVIDGVDTVVSNQVSFTTQPLPHKAYIANVYTLTSPAQGLVTFNYNVSVPTIFFVRYGTYMYVSDTFVVTTPGSGSGSVNITNPYAQGVTYSGNWLRGRAISGIVPDSTVQLNSFTVPGYNQPDVSNTITFTNVVQDSFKFAATIDLGNASSGVVTIRDLDSNGAILYTRPLIPIGSDTVIAPTRFGLPYTMYGERIIVTTNGGSDSTTAFKRTAQILPPDVISVDTVNAAITTTDLTVKVKTNGKPAWLTSDAIVWAKYKDVNNATITLPAQSVSGDTGTVQVLFTGLSNLKTNPSSNTVTVYAQNGASLYDSLIYLFKLKPTLPAVPIAAGWYVDAGNAFQVRTTHVNAGPSTTPYSLYAFRNVYGSGQVDTFLLRINQMGYTNFLTIDTLGNCVGNTLYEIRLATRNSDNIWYVTSSQQILTIPSALQTFYISNGYTVTFNSIDFKVSGCANGTPSYLEIQLALQATPGTIEYSYSLGYQGTGNFSITSGIDNLDDCTSYVLKAILHDGQMGNQVPEEKSFSTDCANGVTDLEAEKFKIYPTTVNDNLSLASPTIIGEVAIYEIGTGREVMHTYVSGTTASLDVSSLSTGMYVLRTTDEHRRFQKQ